MKVLALCDVDKNILKESTDSIYIDEDEYDVDCILDDFDCEFEQLNQSGISLDELKEYDHFECNEEYQGYVYREGTGYVQRGRSTYNKMLCEERLLKSMAELPEEKYDVTRYKICKRNVYTICTKYEEVC